MFCTNNIRYTGHRGQALSGHTILQIQIGSVLVFDPVEIFKRQESEVQQPKKDM